MNRDSPNPTSLRCSFCGNDAPAAGARSLRVLSANYQIIVACGSCGVSFVVISRN